MAKLKLPFELEKPSSNEYVTQASQIGYGDGSVEEALDSALKHPDDDLRMELGVKNISTQSLIHVPITIKNGGTYCIYNTGSVGIPSPYLRVQKNSTNQKQLTLFLRTNSYVEFTADRDYNYLYIYEGTQSANVFEMQAGEYPSMKSDLFKAQEDISELQTNSDNISPSINAAALGYVGKDNFAGFIGSTGTWNLTTPNTFYRIYNVKSGDTIVIKSNASIETQYALLKDYQKPKVDSTAQFCEGCSRVVMTVNREDTVTAPVDAMYLYVLLSYSGGNRKPQKLLINGKDVFNDTVLDKFNAVNGQFGSISTQINSVNTQLNELKSSLISGIICRVTGTSTSYITLTTPIVLSEDGDSVEITATDGGNNASNKAFGFASSGLSANSYHAIQLGRALCGIRAADKTWLFQTKAIPDAATHTLKIEYADSKIYTYMDGTLIDTQNTQRTIQIASFGNGGNGTYGYWKGTISSVIFNGTDIIQQGGFEASEDAQIEYKYVFDEYPKGILMYSASASKFTFYSRCGSSKRYYSFEVMHTVNNNNLVYLNEWGLYGGGLYEYNGSAFTKIATTIHNAENEMAMHFATTIDYTGGVHGDERIDVDNTCFVKFFADGKLITDLSEDFTIECATFSYIQKSTLHQTSSTEGEYVSGHPIIAYHLKNVTFKDCGFRLENVVQFTSEQIVQQYHAGIMCIGKGAATYALLPNMVTTPELTGTNGFHFADNTKGARIDMWNPANNIKVSVEGHYLEGLDDSVDINQFLVWDRVYDSKYYRRFEAKGAVATKTFAANSVIRNEQIVQYY